mmetsp:Transcript_3137/g.4694  ORF Transcript_3137/g.4694 Transcript_3137/m.4694 type:complete len:153 (-) Transcript_3137:179-637(-)|eukprot:CAMPEP_0172425020 /NCGR_PEP_ID=MMETSP1064-20121228/29630_1 /TAXON_ID=202472 /ORGANISM="Aulacoseira subarctica , Strain CCAP 1002/5" /LENGTH=152 /DNA_ID=CAMNT_0013167581 /DNA_START=120 /DNA_END=578 /DNA_ORIENTATION=-
MNTLIRAVVFILFYSSAIYAKKDKGDRGNPKDYPAYATEVATVAATTTMSTQSCSGCGAGTCVFNNYGNYKSQLDNTARQGVFYTKTQEGLGCEFGNTYFSGYVCPCKSVCNDYTNFNGFLNGYCNKFVNGGRSSCRDYIWNCCMYPWDCGN